MTKITEVKFVGDGIVSAKFDGNAKNYQKFGKKLRLTVDM